MVDNFEDAIEQSNYRAIFTNQQEKLIEILESNTLYAYNGGFFKLTPDFFSFLKLNIDEHATRLILLDINNKPITIKKLPDFYKETRAIYSEAVNKYSMGIRRLKRSRLIPTLTKLHDLEDDVEE